MKKVLFIGLMSLFVFTACKDKGPRYSPEQSNVRNNLKGNYHAYINNHEMIYAVISFTAHYINPRVLDEDAKTFLHGECYYSDYKYPIPAEGYITCYYALSEKADIMYFYYRGETNDKVFLRSYNLYVQNEDVFTLTDNGRALTFEKVK
jgi:hypothetical protein